MDGWGAPPFQFDDTSIKVWICSRDAKEPRRRESLVQSCLGSAQVDRTFLDFGGVTGSADSLDEGGIGFNSRALPNSFQWPIA